MRLDRLFALAVALAVAFTEVACGTPPDQAARRDTVLAVTTSGHLIRFRAGTPDKLLWRRTLTGLMPGETVLGIGMRPTERRLYAVGSTSRLYRINVLTGTATPWGEPFTVPLTGTYFGVHFDPIEDRLRIVSDTGQNLRVNPETAAVVDSDPSVTGVQIDGPLAYATGDPSEELRPVVVAAACERHATDDKLTTTFALDSAAGALVTLGNRPGKMPALPPDGGHLFTVGALGTGPFLHAALDISSTGAAYAALTMADAAESRWMAVDLTNGAARLIGPIGGGEPVVGIAIEP